MSLDLLIDQPGLPGMCQVADAVERLANKSEAGERGAIFTRVEVVEFMLDLAGYTADQPLHRLRLLEPSFGGGEFILAAVRRLIAAHRASGCRTALDTCIRAVELHRDTFDLTRAKLNALLLSAEFSASDANRLLSVWLSQGDFLLTSLDGSFDFVIGNPPYVRQELIPAPLLAEYRRRYATLYDRADLYVPFIERSLTELNNGGQMVFICADRWTKNKYGGPLRAHVAKGFQGMGLTEFNSVRGSVDLAETGALNPNARAQPALNADSEHTPVSRSNGILKALSVPLSTGLVAGTSTLIRMDGWTWEDLTLRGAVALHVYWPNLTVNRDPNFPRPAVEQQKTIDENVKRLREAFATARAYRKAKEGALELVIYGKGKEPLLRVPMTKAARTQSLPIEFTSERESDSGRVTLRFVGQYEATFFLTELPE